MSLLKRFLMYCLMGCMSSIPVAHAARGVWKFTAVSAIPSQPGITPEFCKEYSPDLLIAPINVLTQTGPPAKNGLMVKFQSVNSQSKNKLFFTDITADLSRKLPGNNRPWSDQMYIHLQQLQADGIADGVWSTRRCKGRLIAQPNASK